ncbi:MAG: hypothetical protein B7Z73_07480 [Planctomycetia bacterium 21-64-5]|nr:MAG: hypothetical protein B7Z73_07480 [Planctomycetia bacterium 21-64-5]HQU44728.1 hypothetical protein [Pirellulales bacterium]
MCEKCGRAFEVDDQLEGRRAKCRHCGQHAVVPVSGQAADDGLRLRPMESDVPDRGPQHLLDSAPALNLRPGEAQQTAWPSAVSTDPNADDLLHKHGRPNYALGRPFDGQSQSRSSGPPPLWWNLPSLTARFVARLLRKSRDLLYYISLASLVAILYGFLFKVKPLLHVGAVVIVASNIGMFWVGLSYLVTLPFKDSLRHGLACVLVPGYAIYYWATRWHRMRPAVMNTLWAFIPMLLVALAYFFYKEAPAIEAEVEREAPKIEADADEMVKDLESATH